MAAQQQGDLDDVDRCGIAAWSAPVEKLPAIGNWMHDALPNESYDPHFRGQVLETTYFDTLRLELRKARARSFRYITLRLRCYELEEQESYALSCKTEEEKWREQVANALADALLVPGADVVALVNSVLPAHLIARLVDMSGEKPLVPAVQICCRRFAVEDKKDRFTLDVGVRTDTGRRLPYGVLEYKSTDEETIPPASLIQLGLRPLKLSKFLWATES